MSRCLEQNGKAAEAKKYMKKLDEIDAQVDRLDAITRQLSATPDDVALRHEAGMIFLRSGQPKQGLRWLDSALQIDPLYAPTHLALADYFDKIGDRAQASWHRQLAVATPRRGAAKAFSNSPRIRQVSTTSLVPRDHGSCATAGD